MLFSKRFSKSYLSTKERPKLLARVRVATFALWIFQHSFLDRDTLGGFFFFKSIFFASSPTYFCPASAFFSFCYLACYFLLSFFPNSFIRHFALLMDFVLKPFGNVIMRILADR